MIQQTEGIVLCALPYRDHDSILTLFTPQLGILKLYVKRQRGPLSSPLTEGEYLYTQGRGDLARFHDGTIVNQYLALRDSYDTLVTADKLLHAINASQLPGKAAPHLYLLLKKCLTALTSLTHPTTLHTTFLLKILKHDGLLHTPLPHTSRYRFGGECFAKEEAPIGALAFSKEEEETLTLLAHTRILTDLDLPLTPEFRQKIETLFSH